VIFACFCINKKRLIKKRLALVLVAVVLLGTLGAMAAKAMAQEPGEGGSAPILLIAGVLVGAIVVTAVLVVAFHRAASGQSMEILEGY